MEEIYDIAVIGGGVNGAGIARDAAGRGAKVLLLEAGDLAQGTSSASTKLIHGGLRYLEHFEFALVRESLKEREALWAIAPHIIHPMRFVLPYVEGLRPRWLLRLGLFLYDHIGGRKRLPATRTVDLRRHQAGGPLKGGFSTGFEYSDGWVDDARLVVLNAKDAAERGAAVHTRTRVTSARREDGLWRIEAGNEIFHARALVNAAGPRVLEVERIAGDAPEYAMRLVRGSHIVVPRLFDHDYAYFFQLPDGRIFFAIPYERHYTLIGTTDVDHDKSLDKVEASAEEIAYLCDGASRYFSKTVTPADVVWTYSGVRPLYNDGAKSATAATRDYVLSVDDRGAPLLSVFGGKITTYRRLAEHAMEKIARFFPGLAGPWTAGVALPGGDFAVDGVKALIEETRRVYPFLDDRWAGRLVRAYGTETAQVLGAARKPADLGRDFGATLTEAEVNWLMDREYARRADDILWRRSKLGLRMTPAEVAALEDYMSHRAGRRAVASEATQ